MLCILHGGGENNNREKGYKKGIIIFLFTRATPGTPDSYIHYKYFVRLYLSRDTCSFIEACAKSVTTLNGQFGSYLKIFKSHSQ